DKVVVDYTEPANAKGPNKIGSGMFCLQAHDPNSTVYYRNIKVKRLPNHFNKDPAQVLEANATAGYQTRTIEGWTVHVSEALLKTEKEDTENALVLLQRQLAEIVRVVPAKAVSN